MLRNENVNGKVKFAYDSVESWMQVKDAIAGTKTRYYYDGKRVLLETDWDDTGPTETDERYFVYGNYIGEALIMVDDLGGTPDDHYYGHDHLYSVISFLVYCSRGGKRSGAFFIFFLTVLGGVWEEDL